MTRGGVYTQVAALRCGAADPEKWALTWGGRGSNPRPTDHDSGGAIASPTRRNGSLKQAKSLAPSRFRSLPVRPGYGLGTVRIAPDAAGDVS
jgi:hypothetical protein